ncbi:MAG: BON domain-containing protein [Gammaproteobacteria bacterium]
MKTDKQIQQDVISELSWEPSVNAAKIGVEVSDGIVTLAGHVSSYAEKLNAERAAQRVTGVRAITVEMDVKLAGTSVRSDSDIARTAENVLQWMTDLPAERVKVKVEKGWVTLSGEVEWEYQRKIAADAIRNLMGVAGVSDLITIKPKVSAALVQSDIEAALKRRARSNAQNISVAVHDHDVTLSGTVDSWAELELARNSAWSTPGVYKVVDNMAIRF